MKKENQMNLESQLAFPLYITAKEVIRSFQPVLSALDLTYTQYLVMMVIWEYKTANLKMIGDRISLDSGTLTPLLRKLEAKGFITRERFTGDGRSMVIQLTAKGQSLQKKVKHLPNVMDDAIGLSAEEEQILRALLAKMMSNIGAK